MIVDILSFSSYGYLYIFPSNQILKVQTKKINISNIFII